MSDTREEGTPVAFPVISSRAVKQRRSVFSDDVVNLDRSHVMSLPEAMSLTSRRSKRRTVIDDSLQLLDDLTNRPVDPLFEDATLLKDRKQNPSVKVISKVITFLLCVIVGMGSFVAIQELHKDTRQKVREELASQVTDTYERSQALETDIDDLTTQYDTLSDQLAGSKNVSGAASADAIANGTTKVRGDGVVVTVADPRQSDSEKGSSPRDSTSSRIKTVTDTDLQKIISALWSGGAEAIAINGERLGVQSSVRTAGESILVGVNPIETPYTIQAIGDQTALQKALSAQGTATFFATLEGQGIYPDVAKKSGIELDAAGQPDISYAERNQ